LMACWSENAPTGNRPITFREEGCLRRIRR
jgi:hypothetical protein